MQSQPKRIAKERSKRQENQGEEFWEEVDSRRLQQFAQEESFHFSLERIIIIASRIKNQDQIQKIFR